jgi:hypothetical protein
MESGKLLFAAQHKVPRSATVLAEEKCRLLSISGDELRGAGRSAEVCSGSWQRLSARAP